MPRLFTLDTQLNLQAFFDGIARISEKLKKTAANDLQALLRFHDKLLDLIETNLFPKDVAERGNEIGNSPILIELNKQCFLLGFYIDQNLEYFDYIATLPKDEADKMLTAENISQELIQKLDSFKEINSALTEHMIEFNDVDETKILGLKYDEGSDLQVNSCDSPLSDAILEEAASSPIVTVAEENRRHLEALKSQVLFKLFGPQKQVAPIASSSTVDNHPNPLNRSG